MKRNREKNDEEKAHLSFMTLKGNSENVNELKGVQ